MPGGIHEDITLPHTQEWELYHNDFSLCSKKTRTCLAELGIDYKAHPIDLIETGAYENISKHFLKINPAALVPVLVHRGHPVYESHEQLGYAASHSEHPALLVPDDPEERERMQHWVEKTSLIGDDPLRGMHQSAGNAVPALTLPIFAAMIEHVPTRRILTGLLFHRIKQRAVFFFVLKQRGLSRLPEMKPILRILDAGRSAMHAHLGQLEATLAESTGPWIVGSQFTLADVGMMAILDRLNEGDWLKIFLEPDAADQQGIGSDDRALCRSYWQRLQERQSYKEGIGAFRHPAVVRASVAIRERKASDENFRDAMLGVLD